jgi:nucleoid DNA-binding protein
MTFNQLVREYARVHRGKTLDQARQDIISLFDLLSMEVLEGSGSVRIPRIGTFRRRDYPAREVKVPGGSRSPSPITKRVPPSRKVAFVPSTWLKAVIRPEVAKVS